MGCWCQRQRQRPRVAHEQVVDVGRESEVLAELIAREVIEHRLAGREWIGRVGRIDGTDEGVGRERAVRHCLAAPQ